MVMVVLACDPTFYDTLVSSRTSICNGLGIRLLHVHMCRSDTCWAQSHKIFKMDYSVTKIEIPLPRCSVLFSDSHSLSTCGYQLLGISTHSQWSCFLLASLCFQSPLAVCWTCFLSFLWSISAFRTLATNEHVPVII